MTRDDWGWAEPLDDTSGEVAIVGVGESEHTRASGRTAEEIVGDAVDRALGDAGLEPSDVDGIMCVPRVGWQMDAPAFHARYGTSHEMWDSSAGGGMVWAGTAPHTAALAMREGKAKVVLNTFGVAWATQRNDMVGGPGESHAQERYKQNLEVPFGWFPQPVYFATIARRHMHAFGTTTEHLGAVAVQCREHANKTPGAVMHGRPLTMEKYLASPTIADPFRKEDCCLISDGGGAYLMASIERARDMRAPVVEVAGVGLGTSATGSHWAEQGDFTATPQVFSAPAGYAMAGITAADVDVLACYDPFTIHAVMYAEDMGFCAKGEGGPFIADGRFSMYNTHGGLLSHAYVLGIAHVVELVRQLRGTAANQVEGAEVAVYGGYTGPQCSTLVLRKGR